MKRMLKRTLAAVMALTVITGGVPGTVGGLELVKTAYAAAEPAVEVVTVTEGAYFHLGDKLDFGDSACCWIRDDYGHFNREVLSGIKTVDSADRYLHPSVYITFVYVSVDGRMMTLDDLSCFDFDIDHPYDNWDISDVWGFIVHGDGTEDNPYISRHYETTPPYTIQSSAKFISLVTAFFPLTEKRNSCITFNRKTVLSRILAMIPVSW